MIRPQTCPICKKDLTAVGAPAELFPFCSERCRQVDLLRWTTGQYAIVESLDPNRVDAPVLDPESFDPDAAPQPPHPNPDGH